MARKKLLTEGEIRQFMKLANLRPINKVRLSEMGGMGSMPGDRDMPELEDEEEDDSPLGGDMSDDPMGDDPMDAAPEGEDEFADDDMGGDGQMVSLDDFMDALEMAIEDVTGEPASVEEVPGEEEEADMDMEMDAAPPADAGDEPAMEMGDEEEPMMEDQIVAEVARRVAARLQKENQKDQMAEQLAERIFQRLTK